MHEIPIVKDIIKNLEQRYKNNFEQITTVKIEAGLLSNIQPILIQNAFEAIRIENPKLQNIDLQITQLPIIAHCNTCNKNFQVKLHKFICPTCNTPSKNIIQGKELRISSVELNNQ